MKTEDIKVVEDSISLNPGDYIIDSLGKIEEVAYIDYVAKMVVAIAVARESLIGDLSFRSRATIITFDDIASNYQKVSEDTNTIKTTNGDISIEEGDAIINKGRLLKVTDVAYDSGLVDINENGDEYTISLADIESVDYIDSVTQVVTTNPRKNSLIIIANGFNSNSSVKEDEYIEFENIYTAGTAISLEVGDVIIDRTRNKYNVDAIEYDNVTVFCSKGDESYTFPFVAFTECDYMKVTDSYVAVDNNSPKIGDEITGAEGNKYKVVCIDYNDCEVTVRSTDGEEFGFNLDGFDSSVCKKVLK